MAARHSRVATTFQRAAVDAIQDCWDIVRERPADPEEAARAALAKGDYVEAELALRQSMLSVSAEGPGPYVQTLYFYILEYHVFHWRNKKKRTAREEGLEKRIRLAFEEVYHLHDTAWPVISVLAYIQLKLGNHKKCDFLIFEACKFVNDKPLPFIVQSMLYQQWVPPRPLKPEDFALGFLSKPKPVGSRDIDSALKLLKHAIKLDRRVVLAHKCLALLQLQFFGDMEEAQDLFAYALTHNRTDPDSLWWSAEIASELGYLRESRKFHEQAVAADPTCAQDNFHCHGDAGGKAWTFERFAAVGM